MYPRIICNCGRSLGDLYDLFSEIRKDIYKDQYATIGNIDPTLLAVTESMPIEMGVYLDKLKLFTSCCRVIMITQISFKEIF